MARDGISGTIRPIGRPFKRRKVSFVYTSTEDWSEFTSPRLKLRRRITRKSNSFLEHRVLNFDELKYKGKLIMSQLGNNCFFVLWIVSKSLTAPIQVEEKGKSIGERISDASPLPIYWMLHDAIDISVLGCVKLAKKCSKWSYHVNYLH